ncbi:MAG TPA: CPBP family intramembrane glutamic endopeptidase [Candidatus Acidoferrum sp.]|nr:CPBP family intramembrane glutamic endopeptidase [Candidatus Acidoferrum sp.]
MATLTAPRIESANAKLVAPPWHTVVLVTLFLILALGGAFFQRETRTHPGILQQHPHVAPLYFYLIAMEWGLFVYVWKGGLRRTGTKLSELIGGRWTSAREVLVDAALALGLWGIWTLLEMIWVRRLGPDHAASIQTLLPRHALEILLWIAVSISAGICEEFVFRGYFQKQFEAFTHRKWIALFLQSVLFGISHGYQGIEACVKIAIFGSLYGLLALWRKSLRPGMMAHAWSDILSGIFGI